MKELEAIHDSRKSFYGKAKVRTVGNRSTLISYGTEVAYIEDGKAVVIDTYSPTTLRHIREFLQQEGFPIGTKSFIENEYMEDANG